jgi:hypothetical protein
VRKDPVTPELRAAVLARDWACVAPRLDPSAGQCRGVLTLDHVKSQPMMGKRAPSDMEHLVTVCEHHHLWSGWATSHRPLLRRYLEEVTP